ncbi:MAG: hypothetical protein HYT83_00145 [Candidatus Levybacteria bacterium]|nr:hypothetical protein [Candidatus Levybacteria bacterium]
MSHSKEDQPQEQPSWNVIYPTVEAARQARLVDIKRQQLAKGLEPNMGLFYFMNNFPMHLPCYDEDKPGFGGSYRRVALLIGRFDTPYDHIYTEGESLFLSSARILSQTPRQFYAAIDQVLTDLGIDFNRIRDLQRAGGIEICEATVDAFDRLRTVYSKYDLTI